MSIPRSAWGALVSASTLEMHAEVRMGARRAGAYRWRAAALCFLLCACAAEQQGRGRQPTEGLDAAFDAGARGDAATPPLPSDPSEADAIVRFVVLGDGGTGDAAQAKVAAAVQAVCKQRGCSFALYLGDNIYDDGASSVTDDQFQTKFEDPYANLDFPFYVVLGNHDYGNNGTNVLLNDERSSAQVEYTAHSSKWNMPHYYYTFRVGPVAFFALDTNAIVIDRFRGVTEQQAWLEAELAASDAPWKIVFGHHPYLSNGLHGNAGDYGGQLGRELHDGSPLKALVEASICGRVQVYFSGHDHDREWLEPACATSFIVSGAAAKVRKLPGRGAATRFGDDTHLGFMWVEIQGERMTGIFYDEEGHVSYEDTQAR